MIRLGMTKDGGNEELRFKFGRNWKRYLKMLGQEDIERAKKSLMMSIKEHELSHLSFLDIGSGSGIFSRAAYELGFGRIVSFDYDNDSVDATRTLKQQATADDQTWQVLHGSVLDDKFMASLGKFDIVYSWGVLHHTGDMWKAIDNAAAAVKPGGILFIAIYNDQGWISRYWLGIKRIYVASPSAVRLMMLFAFWTYFGVGLFMSDLLRGRNPIRRHIGDSRGMKFLTDVVDWVGGYPFEVAAPDAVINYMNGKGFAIEWIKNVGRRHGCNQYIFRRTI